MEWKYILTEYYNYQSASFFKIIFYHLQSVIRLLVKIHTVQFIREDNYRFHPLWY